MPSCSRTRTTTRTRAPIRSCRSSGEEIDLGSPPAIRTSSLIRVRPRFVSVPCRSASSKTKSATENGGSEFELERDYREQAIGSLDGTDFNYGRAIFSPTWADNIEREGSFVIAAPATVVPCACTRRAFERQPAGIRFCRRGLDSVGRRCGRRR